MLIAYNASNATDATDATDVTIGEQNQKAERQSLQDLGQSELEIEKNYLRSPRILKVTSGNAAKLWKMRQETHVTPRVRKLLEAAIKQIAT